MNNRFSNRALVSLSRDKIGVVYEVVVSDSQSPVNSSSTPALPSSTFRRITSSFVEGSLFDPGTQGDPEFASLRALLKSRTIATNKSGSKSADHSGRSELSLTM